MRSKDNDYFSMLEYVCHIQRGVRVECKMEEGKTVPIKFFCPLCKRYVLPDKNHRGLSMGGVMTMAVLRGEGE